MPRKEGMERKDLLKANVAIFKTQGAALEKYAKKTVRVTVPLCVYDSACFGPLPQSSSSLAIERERGGDTPHQRDSSHC